MRCQDCRIIAVSVLFVFIFLTVATSQPKDDAKAKARAKAEADAAAINEANRNAHQVTVEALTEKFEKAKLAYDVEKKAFDKQTIAYRAAVAEREATKQLNVARMFLDEKNNAVANRRLNSIIKDYPGTISAKEAMTLLGGGMAALRKVPPEPVEPIRPVEPKLNLPLAPPIVQPIYPEDPVEIDSKKKLDPKTKVQPKNVQPNVKPIAEPAPDPAAVAAAGTAVAGFSVCTIIGFVLLGIVALLANFLPTFIAMGRGHPDTVAIALINFFLGCTFVGWFVALIWAVKSFPRDRFGDARDY